MAGFADMHVAACSVNVTLKVHTYSGPSLPATSVGAVKVYKMCDCVLAMCVQHTHLPPVCCCNKLLIVHFVSACCLP